MSFQPSRRQFLHAAAAGGALFGLGDLVLGRLPRVSADEAKLPPSKVRLEPEIEPLVRLLEETPRERLVEVIAARVHRGLSYREVLTALLLAGVRNIQPRPSVGFKFHAVLVVNSAHLASLSAPDADRWLPIFWALDYFKDSQARNARESNWVMGPVRESALPAAEKARQAFTDAMERWDEEAADAAVAALARSAGTQEVFELLYRYGARDFRSIGHKAIYVANSQRTLGCIGWHHAEPVLRSLAYALLMHEGDNPAHRDDSADRPGRRNRELAGRIRADWQPGKPSPDATGEMLAVLRQGTAPEACERVVELLNKGVGPQSLWDAMLAGAGELLLRRPGIVALHAATSTNALLYAYHASGDDLTRRWLLLQNAAFLTMFRDALGGRGGLRERQVDALKPVAPAESGHAAVEEIFADVSRDHMTAAGKALALLQGGGQAEDLIWAARRLVFLKGDDPHDYKFSSAVLEDYYHASPAWRDRYLAASVVQLRSSQDRDNGLVQRIRAALSPA